MELQTQRNVELGGKLEELESELKGKETNAVQIEASLKSIKDNVRQEEKKKKNIEKGMASVGLGFKSDKYLSIAMILF